MTTHGIGFLETLKNPANLFKNNLNSIKNKMKSEIQKKKKLLIPTLSNITGNQDTYFVVIINNRLKIMSVHGAPL